jgi:hypothetical protein
VNRGALVCRFLNRHKWVRVQTAAEEAYRCRRCGKQYYGKLADDPDFGSLGGGTGGMI